MKNISSPSSLIAIKDNFQGKLGSDAIQRAVAVRTTIQYIKIFDMDLSGISIVMPDKKEPDSPGMMWRKVPGMRTLVANYNFLLEL